MKVKSLKVKREKWNVLFKFLISTILQSMENINALDAIWYLFLILDSPYCWKTMKSNRLRSGIGQISRKGVEEDAATQVTRGNLIWVRLNGGSWWPAQVIEILCILVSSGLHKWCLLILPEYIWCLFVYILNSVVGCWWEYCQWGH